MSFAHIQAETILSAVPWTTDKSLEHIVFEWLKLVYHKPCKKKQDYAKVLELYRNHHFNKFLHQQQCPSSEFVNLICSTVLTSKKDYEQLFEKLTSFQTLLEPIPGGHCHAIPVIVLWAVNRPQHLNKFWCMDEIGHEVGVCSQCSTRRHVTLVTRQEPECPANCSWICSNCPLPATAPPQEYALPHGVEQEKMLSDMSSLYQTFLSNQHEQSPYEISWTRHYALHTPSFQAIVSQLQATVSQLRATVSELESELLGVQHKFHSVKNELYELKQWSSHHRYELQKAYKDGQHSCHGYDLRFLPSTF